MGQLAQLSEQLVEDVLALAGNEFSKKDFTMYAQDFEAVDAVLTRAAQSGLRQCATFNHFWYLWKQQLQILYSPVDEAMSVFRQLEAEFPAEVLQKRSPSGLSQTEMKTVLQNNKPLRAKLGARSWNDFFRELGCADGGMITADMFVTYYMTNCFALRIAFTEQATRFAQTVVDVLEDQVSRRHWISLLQFIALPLMIGQWRGRIFNVETTGILMQKLQQALKSPYQSGTWKTGQNLITRMQYTLTENLSAAYVYVDEIRC